MTGKEFKLKLATQLIRQFSIRPDLASNFANAVGRYSGIRFTGREYPSEAVIELLNDSYNALVKIFESGRCVRINSPGAGPEGAEQKYVGIPLELWQELVDTVEGKVERVRDEGVLEKRSGLVGLDGKTDLSTSQDSRRPQGQAEVQEKEALDTDSHGTEISNGQAEATDPTPNPAL